ncbi:MAG TPA: S26 family signal peptidase, partial [Arthrobacter sp.]|nr:S26 family signal peptidase [Arthrobacter sp.]
MPENTARTPEPPREDAPGSDAEGMTAHPVSDGGTSDGGTSDGGPDAGPATPPSGRRSAAPQTGPAARSQLFIWLKEVATVVVIAVVLSFLIKTFLFRAFYIPSESMVSTLDVNDRIFVNLLVPEPFSLSRGDVVVFRDTKGWLTAAPDEPK